MNYSQNYIVMSFLNVPQSGPLLCLLVWHVIYSSWVYVMGWHLLYFLSVYILTDQPPNSAYIYLIVVVVVIIVSFCFLLNPPLCFSLLSFPILSFLSYPFVSHPTLSFSIFYHILSCPILSYPILLYPFLYSIISFPVLSFPTRFFPILTCLSGWKEGTKITFQGVREFPRSIALVLREKKHRFLERRFVSDMCMYTLCPQCHDLYDASRFLTSKFYVWYFLEFFLLSLEFRGSDLRWVCKLTKKQAKNG